MRPIPFAKDGEWVGGFGSVKGPAAIQAFMEKNIPGPNQTNNYQVLTNSAIDVHGDSATAWPRWTFVVPGSDKRSVMAQGGHYDDSLFREHRTGNSSEKWPATISPSWFQQRRKNSSIRFMGMNTPACDGHLKDAMRYSRNLVQRDCGTSLGPGCLPPWRPRTQYQSRKCVN